MRKAFCTLYSNVPTGVHSSSAAIAAVMLLSATQAWALAEGGASGARIRATHFAQDTCRVIHDEARKRELPAAFFARLIWKESLFNPSAVSPVGAQGIAQFMPGTAAERGLVNPFDPAPALVASAHFLSDLKAQFGSLGLAAAAYNAGPERVVSWLAGTKGMPLETQEYVHWITGHSAEDWVEKKGELVPLPISEKLSFMAACQKLAARSLRAKLPDAPLQRVALKKPDAPVQQQESKKSRETTGAKTKKAAEPKPSRAPWGVQVAANFSKKVALAQFARTKAKFPSILGGQSATTVSTKNRSRGQSALHSVRVGAQSKSAAEKLCGRLRQAGGSCLVVRN